MDWTRWPRTLAVVASIALFGVSIAAWWLMYSSRLVLWNHPDEAVYRLAGLLVRRHPAELYDARLGAPGESKLPYLYSPFAALGLEGASVFSFAVWQMALAVIELILLPLIAFASLRLGGSGTRNAVTGAFLVAAVSLWLEPVFMTMSFGQINLILLALMLVDLALPDSSRWKGIGIGLAAGIKLTPLIFLPYLLATRRIRAATVTAITFAATIGIGFVFLPSASAQYWGGKFMSAEVDTGSVTNQSLYAIAVRLVSGHTAQTLLWLALALVTAVAGLSVAVAAGRRGQELLGVVLCGITGLLISPISWTHHWVWVIPALALMAAGDRAWRAWRWRAAGAAAILAVFAMWPTPDYRVTQGHHLWGPSGLIRIGRDLLRGSEIGGLLQNLYVIAGLAALAATGIYLWGEHAREWPGMGHSREVNLRPDGGAYGQRVVVGVQIHQNLVAVRDRAV